MKPLHKKLLTAVAVVGLGLTTVAIANPWGGHGPMGGGMGDCPMMGGGQMTGRGPMGGGGPKWGGDPQQRMAMMQQFHAERMELLAARLKLKSEQESAWKTFIAAQDAHHAEMMKIRDEMRDRETTALAQFEEKIQGMEQHLTSMKTMVKAARDLYATLDPTQKKVMDDFFTNRPMHRMMRGQTGQPVPPAPPAPPAQ